MDLPQPQTTTEPNGDASAPAVPAATLPPSREPPSSSTGFMGRHRLAAAISRLNQQIQMLQEELDGLDSVDGVATVCEELISTVESVPDALLPETKGPSDVGWEKWFQGAQTHRWMRWR